jgi:hypothetical protein
MASEDSHTPFARALSILLRIAAVSGLVALNALIVLGHSRWGPMLELHYGWGETRAGSVVRWIIAELFFALCVALANPARVARALRAGSARVARAPAGLDRYLHGPGFELSHAVCHVCVCLGLARLRSVCVPPLETFSADPAFYDPVGLLILLGPKPPSPAMLQAIDLVFWISLATSLLGLFSRASLVICTASLALLTGLIPSSAPAWSHGAAPVLLWAIGNLLGPPTLWSLDRHLLPRLGFPCRVDRAASRRPVLLGQAMVALIFFNAASYKLFLGNDVPFSWAATDSMRNLILFQYWILGRPLPGYLATVVASPVLWRLLAAGNLVSQGFPIAACFLTRRPKLRALAGLLVGCEVLGLGFVMQIWNVGWLFFCVSFIDWDALVARLRRDPVPPVTELEPSDVSRPRIRPGTAWGALLLASMVFVAFFHPRQRRWTFPFTSFPMYCKTYALRPFDEHLPYPLYGTIFDIDANPPLTPSAQRYLQMDYYPLSWEEDVPGRSEQVCANLESRFGIHVRAVKVSKAIYAIAPYPRTDIAVVASHEIYRRDEKERSFARWNWEKSPEQIVLEAFR